MAITVYRVDHPNKFVVCDELGDGDVFVCEGVATEEQAAAFQPDQKKKGKKQAVESEIESGAE